jgi:hypothetical protein
MVAQFAKVAVSVLVLRTVAKLFQTGAASQQAYARAQNLWTHGHRDEGYGTGNAARWRPATNAGTQSSYGPAGTSGGNGFDHSGRNAIYGLSTFLTSRKIAEDPSDRT